MSSDTPILKFEDLINFQKPDDNNTNTESQKELKSNQLPKKSKSNNMNNIPRGKPKSGRMWKSQKTRCKSVIKTRGLKLSFEKRQKLREELKRVKEASRAIIEANKQEKEQKRLRTLENKKRYEENCKKSEIVQVIKNPSKIKKMKRKQLRAIEKRDTNT